MISFYGIKLFLEGQYSSGSDMILIALLALYSCFVGMRAVRLQVTMRISKTTLIVLIATFLAFSMSLLRKPDGVALRYFGKYFFCMLLFFNVIIMEKKRNDSVALFSKLWNFYHMMFYICMIYNVMGTGIKTWGNSTTLIGAYYYKTDYAGFLFQFMIVSMYKTKTKQLYQKIYVYSLMAVSLVLILLTNTRMYIPLIIAFVVFFVYDAKGYTVKQFLNWKFIFMVLVIIFVTALLLMWVPTLFPSRHMLTFNFEDGLLGRDNTQGRSVIWENIMSKFQASSMFSKLFGLDLSGVIAASDLDMAAHNMYIYILYAFGYVGAGIFLAFFLRVLFCALHCPDRRLGYTLLLVFSQYMISGLTQDCIIYTNQTAFLFLTLSICEVVRINQTS